MNALRSELDSVSFPNLWGQAVHFLRKDEPLLVSVTKGEVLPGIVLPLDLHLRSLATKLSVRESDQRFLFPALAVT